jgi:hypothetical protein
MVQESNARVQNIICGMILALLCMPLLCMQSHVQKAPAPAPAQATEEGRQQGRRRRLHVQKAPAPAAQAT